MNIDSIYDQMAGDSSLLHAVANLLARGPGAFTRNPKIDPPGVQLGAAQGENILARILSARLNNEEQHPGIVQRESDGKWFFLHMLWTKTDGVWRGKWIYRSYDRDTEWDRLWSTLRIFRYLDPAPDSRDGGTIPQEVLFYVVHYMLDEHRSGLVSVGMTCRAYLKICASRMYSRLYVSTPRIAEFIQDASKRGSLIPASATAISIRGQMPSWIMFAKLLKLLPAICELSVANSGLKFDSPSSYNSAPGITCSVMLQAGSPLNLQKLSLTDHLFASTVDLLRFVGSFPLLTELTLLAVFVNNSPCVAPPVKTTRLRYMRLSLCQWRLWRVVLCWKWPHPAGDPNVGAFPGLQHTDAVVIADMLEAINIGFAGSPPKQWDVSLYLDESFHEGSWVVSIVVVGCGEVSLELELHAVTQVAPEGDNPESTAAQRTAPTKVDLKHIVIPVRSQTNFGARIAGGIPIVVKIPPPWDHVFAEGVESISFIDKQLSRLSHLDTVTIETTDETAPGDVIAEKLKTVRESGKLRRRTCEEARQIALDAIEQDARGYEGGIVSPLFSTEDYMHSRSEWLSIPDEVNDSTSEAESDEQDEFQDESENGGIHEERYDVPGESEPEEEEDNGEECV